MKKGQTLVEIIVVIGMVVLLATGLVIVSTVSMKTNRIGTLRSQAVKYASEGMELVRQKRDASWTDFRIMGGVWCLNDGGLWFGSTVCTQNINNFFGRSVEFTWNDVEQRMDVMVTVDWNEGGNYYSTELNSYFTQWN